MWKRPEWIDSLPPGRNRTWGVGAQGVVYKRGEYPLAFVHVVTDGYLKAAGISLREDRDFSPTDTDKSQPVVLVNETFARHLWPGQNPLGRLLVNGKTPFRVIGVRKDVHYLGPEQTSGNEVYWSVRQVPDYGSMNLVVRSRLDTRTLTSNVRRVLSPSLHVFPKSSFRRSRIWSIAPFRRAALSCCSFPALHCSL